jgi:hypothetical protein
MAKEAIPTIFIVERTSGGWSVGVGNERLGLFSSHRKALGDIKKRRAKLTSTRHGRRTRACLSTVGGPRGIAYQRQPRPVDEHPAMGRRRLGLRRQPASWAPIASSAAYARRSPRPLCTLGCSWMLSRRQPWPTPSRSRCSARVRSSTATRGGPEQEPRLSSPTLATRGAATERR